MSGVTANFIYWWNIIRGIFRIGEFNITGSISLGPGEHEVIIDTTLPNPSSIFTQLEEPDNGGITTCMGNLNWIATRPLEQGFILYARIVTDSCNINYVVKYDAATPIKETDKL